MKTVLVTGATSGIGLAAAQRFQQLGLRVLITGRRQNRLDQALHMLNQGAKHPVEGWLCDQSDSNAIQQLANTLQQQKITLDSLVLNAGIFQPQPFAELTRENIDAHMEANFIGPALLVHALLPQLNHPASVVFVSSIAAQKAFATGSAYSASKAAFEALATVLNVELASAGIRVNSVRPGVTLTDIQAKAGMDEESIAALNDSLKQIPQGGMMTVEDIVPSIEYLALDGSRAMRNACLTVDGGYCL